MADYPSTESKSPKPRKIVWLLAFLILLPIPLGLGRSQINVLFGVVAITGVIAFGANISRPALAFLLFLVGFFLTTSTIDNVINPHWGEVDYFQVFRVSYFAIAGWFIYTWGEAKTEIFTVLERLWPVCISLLVAQIPLAYFDPGSANIPLGGIDSAADLEGTPRIYIYPYALLYGVLPIFILQRQLRLAALSTVLLGATGSRQIYIYVLLCWIIGSYDKEKPHYAFYGILTGAVISVLALQTGLLDRFLDSFRDGGDHIRSEEINAALGRWRSGVISTALGIGVGTRYWEGWDYILQSFDYEAWQANSGYDVHNGFASLLLRFGALGLSVLIFVFRLVHREVPLQARLLMTMGVLLSLSSSSAFYTSDLPMYMIALGYAKWKYSDTVTARVRSKMKENFA